MKKYKARNGSQMTNEEACLFGEFLEQEFMGISITPESVVEKARKKTSAIHKFFEWNDSKAGELYRQQQARGYIGGIVIESSTDEEIRAFHHIKIGEIGEYVSLSHAQQQPELWKQILDKALLEAENWSRRYQAYKQLEPIHTSIRKTRKYIEKGKKDEKQISAN